MVDLIIILGISAVMLFVDLPALKRKKKELIVYLTILTCGIGLFAAEAFHLDIPNPLNVIIFLFKPMTQWINSLFK